MLTQRNRPIRIMDNLGLAICPDLPITAAWEYAYDRCHVLPWKWRRRSRFLERIDIAMTKRFRPGWVIISRELFEQSQRECVKSKGRGG